MDGAGLLQQPPEAVVPEHRLGTSCGVRWPATRLQPGSEQAGLGSVSPLIKLYPTGGPMDIRCGASKRTARAHHTHRTHLPWHQASCAAASTASHTAQRTPPRAEMGAHTPVEFDVESTPVALGREDGCPHFNRRELGTDAQRASAQTTLHPDTAETTNEKESIDCTADSSDQILVGWDEGETDNPLNWSPAFRWILSYWGGIVVGCSTFISTIPNGVMGDIMAHFKVGHEVGALITALNVLGFAAGPLVFGPLSERVGRRPVFLLSTLGTCLFSLGCSLTPNIGGLLACRFLGGVFAAAPYVLFFTIRPGPLS